jgi:hypothetical protein
MLARLWCEGMGMTQKLAWVPLVGLCLLTVGCTIGQEEAVVPPPVPLPPQPAASPLTTAIAAAPIGLITPTDPGVRLKEIKSGRPDPFASVLPPPAPPRSTGGLSGTANGNGTGTGANPSQPGLPGLPALPPVPEPTQAKGVKVSGIMLVSGLPRAIVTAPNEAVSRTVSVGDRLSNGAVLVKSIDANGSNPMVVLEQYGQDVSVAIGEEGVVIASAPGSSGPVPALFPVRKSGQ